MNSYLDRLDYAVMDVDSNTIDNFWLMGNSRITQRQQIDFLKRLLSFELPFSENTKEIMKKLMLIEETGQYRLSGKSGLSNENDNYNGWFVGYMESETGTYFFATNIEPKHETDIDSLIKKRMEVTLDAFKKMEMIR